MTDDNQRSFAVSFKKKNKVLLTIIIIFLSLLERDRDNVSGGGVERENPKQAPHCQHRARHEARTPETMRS